MIPVIVLSGHTTGLGVIRALGRMGVPVANLYYEKTDMGYVSKYVTEKIHAPHPEQYEEKFVELLVERSRKKGRAVLMPADDATLLVVSKNKPLLEKHYLVACTDWEITEQFIDKKNTYALADRIGVLAPKTLIPKSVQDLEAFAQNIEYPCLIKPRQSHRYYEVFKRKMVKVDDFGQMLSAYLEAREAGLDVMLQEFIPGDDDLGVNYNSYRWGNSIHLEFTARKVRLSPPHFGVPSVVQSAEVPEVVMPARNILSALGYYGYSCTEFKKDPRDGRYRLLEINGRHNRSALLSVLCGLNFPWYEYRHLVHGEMPSQKEFTEGVFWIDELKDIAQMFMSFGKSVRCINQCLEPYRKKRIYAVFDRRDMLPLCKRIADLSFKAFKKMAVRDKKDHLSGKQPAADIIRREVIEEGAASKGNLVPSANKILRPVVSLSIASPQPPTADGAKSFPPSGARGHEVE